MPGKQIHVIKAATWGRRHRPDGWKLFTFGGHTGKFEIHNNLYCYGKAVCTKCN